MARRTRGRGHIEERPNGTFRAVVYAGKDPHTGRDRYLKKTAPDEKQAQVALSALLNQVDEQRHPRSGITVRQVIAKWFDVADHACSTRHAYVELVSNYIDPAFGNMQVAKLDPELLEGFDARSSVRSPSHGHGSFKLMFED